MKETREVLMFLIAAGKAYRKITSDGKINLLDVPALIGLAGPFWRALSGIAEVPGELRNFGPDDLESLGDLLPDILAFAAVTAPFAPKLTGGKFLSLAGVGTKDDQKAEEFSPETLAQIASLAAKCQTPVSEKAKAAALAVFRVGGFSYPLTYAAILIAISYAGRWHPALRPRESRESDETAWTWELASKLTRYYAHRESAVYNRFLPLNGEIWAKNWDLSRK